MSKWAKWAKDTNRQFMKILYIKHMKRCSRTLKIRELQIKSTPFSFWQRSRSLMTHLMVRYGETDTLMGCCWNVNFINLYNLSGGQFINLSPNYKDSIWPRNSPFSNLSDRCLTGVKWHMYKVIHCPFAYKSNLNFHQ